MVQPQWRTVWRFLEKLKIELPYDPGIPLLGIYLRNMERLIQKDMCHREIHSILCDSLYGKKNLKKSGYMYMYSRLLCCTPETNTIL